MARIPVRELSRYLLTGNFSSRRCLHRRIAPCLISNAPKTPAIQRRDLQTSSDAPLPPNPEPRRAPPAVPLRKQLKDDARARKASGKPQKQNQGQTVPGWELTVGIEIHAQLNTAKKLFSPAVTSFNDTPNSHVAWFDLALPGAQPLFQRETLIPAIRAALALNCDIQRVSHFDRKHYFHWDQPSGYQITQYYEPFAKNGYITLYERDGIAPEDGQEIRIDIKQIQMEQDTAKTIAQPGEVHWLDFNRVGVPLIEIITLPQIHHPATAAALVRKIQLLLNSVDACTSGMEAGGLRADVNVSVRRTDDPSGKLGTRTEIKNLNSFKAVEDAIIAERNRQILELERGNADAVQSETRGWAPGQHGGETHRLRGKEGEVDYRYMPDPDLGPVVIDEALVELLRLSMGALPDAELQDLIDNYGLSAKDAMSLMLLDGGGRVQFYYDVVDAFEERLEKGPTGAVGSPLPSASVGSQIKAADSGSHRAFVGNWVLHQLGRLTSERNSNGDAANDLEMTPDGTCRIPVEDLADILYYRYQNRITGNVAKELLFAVFRGDLADPGKGYVKVTDVIEKENLWFDEISKEEYLDLAQQAMEGEEKTLKQFVNYTRYPQGKLQFLVGKMMRVGPEGRTDPQYAEEVMKERIEQYVAELRSKA